MPINSLVKCLFNFWTVMFQKTIHGQFVKNSWTFMFQKTALSPFIFCLFLSFPLFSSLFLSFPPLLSFFNVHPAHPANSLKTKDLRKRHFWLKILSQGKPLRLKTLGENSLMICSLPRRPYTPQTARNWPYMLRRETLHYVGFHVGFADPILHT